jgi:20S proteasome alpha/beta subunit
LWHNKVRLSHNNNNNSSTGSSFDHGIDVTRAPYEVRFSPYDFNGGTTLAVAGKDFAIVAADTRLSSGLRNFVAKGYQAISSYGPLCIVNYDLCWISI